VQKEKLVGSLPLAEKVAFVRDALKLRASLDGCGEFAVRHAFRERLSQCKPPLRSKKRLAVYSEIYMDMTHDRIRRRGLV
jgi:hypothetical protein